MNFKQIVKDYFTFSRNERKGITVLLVIIFLLAITNKVIFYFETPGKIDTSLLDSTLNGQNQIQDTLTLGVIERKLFRFDPNTISKNELDSLSIPETIKRNLLKFREKGGIIYSVADFRKIYGVTDSIYKQLAPFLDVENKQVKPITAENKQELFVFDPNTASDKDFQRLGLSEKQIKTIRNYQSKGGNFKSKADFSKIYGISRAMMNILVNYIVIQEVKMVEPVKINENDKIRIEINAADSVDLMKLPGVGNKLSKRIVKYRDLLGGFYALAQLKEVYGLNEETIHQFSRMVKVDSAKVSKIDLNFADWNELAKHPYIQNSIARKIVRFRTRYGSIHNPAVLLDSMILNIDEYARLKPYL